MNNIEILPKNWPNNIEYKNYIDNDYYIRSINPCLWGIEIRKITDDNHILKGQYGVFAITDLEPLDILGVMTGDIIRNGYVGDKYCMPLTRNLSISALKSGNETKYINHFKNISNEPNIVLRMSNILGKINQLCIVKNPIKKGDELLLDYGEKSPYWEYNSQLNCYLKFNPSQKLDTNNK